MRLLATIDEYLKTKNYTNYMVTDDIYSHFTDRTKYWIFYSPKYNRLSISKPDSQFEEIGMQYRETRQNKRNAYTSIDYIELDVSNPQLLDVIENILSEKL